MLGPLSAGLCAIAEQCCVGEGYRVPCQLCAATIPRGPQPSAVSAAGLGTWEGCDWIPGQESL